MVEIKADNVDEDAVLREVFDVSDIEAKTELTDSQIQAMNKLSTLSDIFGNTMLKNHIREFMVLQKSRERKSMGEFVSVVKAKREDFVGQGKGFFSSLMG